MNIQEILGVVKEHGAEEVKSILEKMRQENEALRTEAQAAKSAYFADVKRREDRIKQRVEALSHENDTLAEKILAMRPGLVAATVNGDASTVDKIQREIADIEAQKAAVVTQIDLLSGANVPGNEELFRVADEKLRELNEDSLRLREIKKMVFEFAGEQEELWNRLKEDNSYYNLAGGTVYHSEKLYEHFQQK
ncbi:hypothetical protein H9X86_10380 [Pseudoflavonifractor capillosus]|uniref:hypothetical protein n=1 Tax=Pseudoflavonifractor capillosus TaxID=106588 RepID=UPI00195DA21D|nr:hypothetical protein [Pseudoflavonifractor capillosus]MBM6897760.1 hypothetical protein [Pseudoflavonifractor capillosus]